MRDIRLIGLECYPNDDADHFGSVLVNTIAAMKEDGASDCLHVLKVQFENNSLAYVQTICSDISECIARTGITNYVVIPVGAGGIQDVKLERIEIVQTDGTNKNTHKTTD